ncbi:dynamin family protein [Neobacillus niacini]|uniref:dynamin family protein n=1 Tax=Neobacillus niacini TaxID=86668 RepID=UPI0028660D9D|nr:dynamin family protein [Neobacillus niacini]MDR6998137.1 small GTP-binding protein [Neobacillus niacini]
MVQTTNQQETAQSLKNKLMALYEFLLNEKDVENAGKLKQLAKKMEYKEFVVAFCGHFSAGKSTMINKVIGENLLPSSPIPTSANLVKVKTGEDYAKVFFKNEKPRIYLAPYDYELVKNYCKDGDQIEGIEISHSESNLPANTVIMDTPGIDSADDAHRIATESALHLADLIFYVMDYNHVQAELNFLFTKELAEAGKEVYLVINQIDKHNDDELSFTDFQKSVIDSFATWGVRPKRIFYTSLKKQGHRFNEFAGLKQFIAEKLASKDEALLPAIYQSFKKIAQDHINQAKKGEKEKLSPILEKFNELSEDERNELVELHQLLQTKMGSAAGSLEQSEKKFDEDLTEIIKNAYLMPFQTRSLAETYLESSQPEFKVGFLFSKQKTQEERGSRLERFYQDMLEKTKEQLEWHLREFLLEFLKEHEIDQSDLIASAQALKIDFPVNLLVASVKPGARLSGEYVLNYTEEVASKIKKLARERVEELKAEFLDALMERNDKVKNQYQQEYNKIEPYIQAMEEAEKYQQEMKSKTDEVDAITNLTEQVREDTFQLFDHDEKEYEVVQSGVTKIKQAVSESKNIENKQLDTAPVALKESPQEKNQLKKMVERLRKNSSHIHNLPGFKKLAMELEEKAARLENKGFTVALFGAFSAGKSSFANALMGEKILPVSPNPTTAAINKIKPVSETTPHGMVLVKFKETGAMLEDVNRSLKVFDLQVENLAEASGEIDKVLLQKDQDGIAEKTHFAFLQAFKKGYHSFHSLLGTVLETDLSEFTDFVAKEEKSCYVEWIELFYDCELTRKGITLVDTPGADSINARHTGVAFDYIKNSDAILFVTYYNHAFSKADREFLIQLGRVKDSFQLDKMFFIINAIDLAENEEEKNTVLEYVKDQLGKYGIRNPHLHPLSSLLAIKEKQDPSANISSNMVDFERSFYQFISNDLTQMAIASAENELSRVHELVNKLIQSATEDQSIKEQKRSAIENQKTRIKELLDRQSVDGLQNRMRQEAEELIFYIKKRVFLRFSDFFKEAFNPSTLRDDGRNLKKALQAALDEFLESLGFDFAQEMRATSVRLDRFTEKIIADFEASFVRSLMDINEDLSFSRFEVEFIDELKFDNAFKNMNKQSFSKTMSYFKNPKSFFEKNEKKLMMDELNNVLNTPAEEYLKDELSSINHHYTNVLMVEFNKLLSHIQEQSNEFYLSLLSALEGGVSLEALRDVQQKLEE